MQGSSSSGRKVTEAVIWRMMACISDMTSFAVLSTVASPCMALSVCTSKTQRSSVSPVLEPVMTTTSFCTLPVCSHSARAWVSGVVRAVVGEVGGRCVWRTCELAQDIVEVCVELVVRGEQHGESVVLLD